MNPAAADIVDTSHVDEALASARRNEESARKRAMLWTVAKSVLLGGVGIGALCFGASFLLQPRIIETEKVVEVPKVLEVPKMIEVPAKVAEKEKESQKEKEVPKVEAPSPTPGLDDSLARCERLGHTEAYCTNHALDGELLPPEKVAKAPVAPTPAPTPLGPPKAYDPCFSATTGSHCKVETPPPAVAPAPESHPWDAMVDKRYTGIITDVIGNRVCYDHDTDFRHCTQIVVTDANGHAVLDRDGNMIGDDTQDFEPMRKWIGYSAYSAAVATDPAHLSNFWVANNGVLIKFEMEPSGKQASREPHSSADSVALRTGDDGKSLFIDADLGTSAYSFVLDTGASDLTVTETVAARLVRDGHATSGQPETVTLADGSSHTVPTLTINTVTVGTHRVSDVHATVSSDNAPMLLGMGVLNRIGRFSVDAPNRQLTFDGAES